MKFLCLLHPGSPEVNPLGPYTPEAAESIKLSADAIKRSQILRREVANAIEETSKLQKQAHKSVNSGLTKKVAESMGMKVCTVSFVR